eukprot:gene31570-6762_t
MSTTPSSAKKTHGAAEETKDSSQMKGCGCLICLPIGPNPKQKSTTPSPAKETHAAAEDTKDSSQMKGCEMGPNPEEKPTNISNSIARSGTAPNCTAVLLCNHAVQPSTLLTTTSS